MDFKVFVKRCNFKNSGNYFLLLQLDELQFPEKTKVSQKQRTEVIPRTSNPTYNKNIFIFQNLSLGSRLALKIGCFTTSYLAKSNENEQLFKNSTLYSSAVLTLTQKLITILREKPSLEQELILYDETKSKELGRIAIEMQFKPANFDQLLQENNRVIEKLYFDPFIKDEQVIAEKKSKLEKLISEKQKEYESCAKKLEFINTAIKSISFEHGRMIQQKKVLDKQNLSLKESIDKYNDVSELHIHIDMLKGSEQGTDILRSKLAQFITKLQIERSLYHDMSEHYFKIEQYLNQKARIEKEITQLQDAIKEQNFHLLRCQDQQPQLLKLKDTIKNYEILIERLQQNVKENFKKLESLNYKEINTNLKSKEYEQQLLKEKKKQVEGMKHIHDGQLPLNYLQNLKKEKYLLEDQQQINQYKLECETYLQQIEQITSQIEDIHLEEEVIQQKYNMKEQLEPSSNLDSDTAVIKFEIELAQSKAKSLEEELLKNVKQSAEVVANLKYDLTILQNRLDSIVQ